MIFLIDDKKQRQLGYGWNDDKFEHVKEFVMPIYNYEQILEENRRNTIFKSGNVVLFHESFFDTTDNKHEKDSLTIRVELEKYAKSSDDFMVAFFSGSKNSRFHDKNIINLPVGTLYANLEIFIEKYAKSITDPRFLLFGENPVIEEYLTKEIEFANQNLDLLKNYESSAKNLYLKPSKDFIQKPLQDFDEKIIFKVSDKDFNEKVLEWLSEKKYDNIFIPLCFGSILSDYSGLRLALHIRTTHTLSQFANIFIYGIVDHPYLIQNEYFDILKTKNVMLIGYKRASFKDALFLNLSDLNLDNLAVELAKIKLNPPGNYFDNHSIANVWGVYQLARNANIKIDEIKGFELEKLSDIYFKWLIAKNNLNISISEEQKNEQLQYSEKLIEQLRYSEKLPGLKVVKKIDLSKFNKK